MAILCTRNASDHNYRNSLVIVNLATGQTPRSMERICGLSSNNDSNKIMKKANRNTRQHSAQLYKETLVHNLYLRAKSPLLSFKTVLGRSKSNCVRQELRVSKL